MSAALPPSPRWEGFTLQQKYDWFQAQPGAGMTEPTATSLGGLGADFGDSATVLQRSMGITEPTWQGQSATATADAMSRAAQWAQNSGQTGASGGSQVDGYGSSWTTTKNQIAAPVPEGSETWWDHVTSVFGVQSDYAKNVAANHAADQAANQALAAHDASARAAVNGFQDAAATPPLTAGPAPSDGGLPGAGGVPGAAQRTGVGGGSNRGGSGAGSGGGPAGAAPVHGAGGGSASPPKVGARAVGSQGPGAGGVAGTGKGVGAAGTSMPSVWTPVTPTSPASVAPSRPGAGGFESTGASGMPSELGVGGSAPGPTGAGLGGAGMSGDLPMLPGGGFTPAGGPGLAGGYSHGDVRPLSQRGGPSRPSTSEPRRRRPQKLDQLDVRVEQRKLIAQRRQGGRSARLVSVLGVHQTTTDLVHARSAPVDKPHTVRWSLDLGPGLVGRLTASDHRRMVSDSGSKSSQDKPLAPGFQRSWSPWFVRRARTPAECVPGRPDGGCVGATRRLRPTR